MLSPQDPQYGPGPTWITDDGQIILVDGPPIVLTAKDDQGGAEHKMEVGMVSGANGRDVLVVDGVSQTLGASAATGLPRSGRAGSASSGHEGMDMGDASSSSGGKGGSGGSGYSPDRPVFSPSGLGKSNPALYYGEAADKSVSWAMLGLSVCLGALIAL